jgi:hypothetical protein
MISSLDEVALEEGKERTLEEFRKAWSTAIRRWIC